MDSDSPHVGYQSYAGCFPAEALVLLINGSSRPIANLKEGDLVATSTRYRDRTVGAPVLSVVRYERARCITINRQLTLTPSHPLLVNNNWWPAGDARLGDYLVGVDGPPIAVTSLETSSEDQQVYIPVLPPDHVGFFVDNVLVQNVVDREIYEEFRRSGSNPESIAFAAQHLAEEKVAMAPRQRHHFNRGTSALGARPMHPGETDELDAP
jgi:hypothetical protein